MWYRWRKSYLLIDDLFQLLTIQKQICRMSRWVFLCALQLFNLTLKSSFYSFSTRNFLLSFHYFYSFKFLSTFPLFVFFLLQILIRQSRSEINSNKHVFDISFFFATHSVSFRICLRCRHQLWSFLFFNGVLLLKIILRGSSPHFCNTLWSVKIPDLWRFSF